MNKKQLAIKILLPILIILIIALLVLEIKSYDFHNDEDNGLLFAISILLNIVPMIAMALLGIALTADCILLFVLKSKKSATIGAIVILSLMLPFAGFSAFIDFTALIIYPEVPIIVSVVFAAIVASLVISCLLLSDIKKTAIAIEQTE